MTAGPWTSGALRLCCFAAGADSESGADLATTSAGPTLKIAKLHSAAAAPGQQGQGLEVRHHSRTVCLPAGRSRRRRASLLGPPKVAAHKPSLDPGLVREVAVTLVQGHGARLACMDCEYIRNYWQCRGQLTATALATPELSCSRGRFRPAS